MKRFFLGFCVMSALGSCWAASDPYGTDVVYGNSGFQFSIHQSATTSDPSSNTMTFNFSVNGDEHSVGAFAHWDPANGNPAVHYDLTEHHQVDIKVTIAPGCSISTLGRHQYTFSHPNQTNEGTDYSELEGDGSEGTHHDPDPADTGWVTTVGFSDFTTVQALNSTLTARDVALLAFLKSAGGTGDFCSFYNLLNDPCFQRTLNGGMGPLTPLLLKYANPTWTDAQVKNYDPNGSGLPWWRNRVVYLNNHWSNTPSAPGAPTDNISLWLAGKGVNDPIWGPYHQTSPLTLANGDQLQVVGNNVADDFGVHCPDGTGSNVDELGNGGAGTILTGGGAGTGSGGTTGGGSGGGSGGTVSNPGGTGVGSPTGDGEGGNGTGGTGTTTAGGGYSPGAGTQPGNAGGTFAALVGSWGSLAPGSQTAATVSFAIPIPGGSTETFTISSIPDTSTGYGTALNALRLIFRSFLMILLLFKFFKRIYGDLVPGKA